MAMLAERRQRKKWAQNPQGMSWSKDTSKFGQKLLEKMGWSPGEGLGAQRQGRSEILKVQHKFDNKGLGFQGNDEKWLQHQNEFNDILNKLNGKNQASDTTPSVTSDETHLNSLELKSKQSKKRIHYHKFIRAKDVSKYNEKDLVGIFGTNIKIMDRNVEKIESSNQINAGSMEDYFKEKLKNSKIKNFEIKPNNCEIINNFQNENNDFDNVERNELQNSSLQDEEKETFDNKRKISKKEFNINSLEGTEMINIENNVSMEKTGKLENIDIKIKSKKKSKENKLNEQSYKRNNDFDQNQFEEIENKKKKSIPSMTVVDQSENKYLGLNELDVTNNTNQVINDGIVWGEKENKVVTMKNDIEAYNFKQKNKKSKPKLNSSLDYFEENNLKLESNLVANMDQEENEYSEEWSRKKRKLESCIVLNEDCDSKSKENKRKTKKPKENKSNSLTNKLIDDLNPINNMDINVNDDIKFAIEQKQETNNIESTSMEDTLNIETKESKKEKKRKAKLKCDADKLEKNDINISSKLNKITSGNVKDISKEKEKILVELSRLKKKQNTLQINHSDEVKLDEKEKKNNKAIIYNETGKKVDKDGIEWDEKEKKVDNIINEIQACNSKQKNKKSKSKLHSNIDYIEENNSKLVSNLVDNMDQENKYSEEPSRKKSKLENCVVLNDDCDNEGKENKRKTKKSKENKSNSDSNKLKIDDSNAINNMDLNENDNIKSAEEQKQETNNTESALMEHTLNNIETKESRKEKKRIAKLKCDSDELEKNEMNISSKLNKITSGNFISKEKEEIFMDVVDSEMYSKKSRSKKKQIDTLQIINSNEVKLDKKEKKNKEAIVYNEMEKKFENVASDTKRKKSKRKDTIEVLVKENEEVESTNSNLVAILEKVKNVLQTERDMIVDSSTNGISKEKIKDLKQKQEIVDTNEKMLKSEQKNDSQNITFETQSNVDIYDNSCERGEEINQYSYNGSFIKNHLDYKNNTNFVRKNNRDFKEPKDTASVKEYFSKYKLLISQPDLNFKGANINSLNGYANKAKSQVKQ